MWKHNRRVCICRCWGRHQSERKGDEVITAPFTFASTAEVIVLLGARPVFVDIDPQTCNIGAAKIGAAVTPQTKAIMPVSLYGQPADMDEINDVAALHGSIPVIEDAAQSFGASYKLRKSCNLSTVGCTSFFPSKPLGCYGDGGAIFTNDDSLAMVMREVRLHGQERRYYHTRLKTRPNQSDRFQLKFQRVPRPACLSHNTSHKQDYASRYGTHFPGVRSDSGSFATNG
jgi:dTDP-4-amino-4,6-dideoxygalactose transaminase